MSDLPVFPDIPSGMPPMVEDEKPDTTRADTEAAMVAWEEASKAIMAAWKITPKHMLRTRRVIRRNEFNQGIAAECSDAMIDAGREALRLMRIASISRTNGREAPATDAEAVAEMRNS